MKSLKLNGILLLFLLKIKKTRVFKNNGNEINSVLYFITKKAKKVTLIR